MWLNEPLSCSSSVTLPLLTLHKEGGISITHLLKLPQAAHTCCCTFRGTGGHCDLPAAPLHPHSQDSPIWEPHAGITSLAARTQSSPAIWENQPTGPKMDTTRSICAWLTTDLCLQRVLQVQGCCCLHCSQVQQPPRGTRTPQEHSAAPRDNKMTVPAPRAGSYHHHYYNLVRGAASLKRHCLHANTPLSSGLRALNISAGEQQK